MSSIDNNSFNSYMKNTNIITCRTVQRKTVLAVLAVVAGQQGQT